jgi:hypothetical protein
MSDVLRVTFYMETTYKHSTVLLFFPFKKKFIIATNDILYHISHMYYGYSSGCCYPTQRPSILQFFVPINVIMCLMICGIHILLLT